MVRLTLDVYLKAHRISRYQLAKKAEIGYPIIDKYYKNKVMRYDSFILDRICKALQCDVADILSFEDDANP